MFARVVRIGNVYDTLQVYDVYCVCIFFFHYRAAAVDESFFLSSNKKYPLYYSFFYNKIVDIKTCAIVYKKLVKKKNVYILSFYKPVIIKFARLYYIDGEYTYIIILYVYTIFKDRNLASMDFAKLFPLVFAPLFIMRLCRY